MGQNKVNRTVELQEEMQNKAVLAPVQTKFAGMQVFILVPMSSGHDPQVMAQEFDKQLKRLRQDAEVPTPREMMDMSIAGIPAMVASAKEN